MRVTFRVDGLYDVDRVGSRSKAAATPPCLLAVCTDERNGPGREYAPHLKGLARFGSGPRRPGARGARRVTTTDGPLLPSRSSSSCSRRKSPAVPGHPVWVEPRLPQEKVQQCTVEQLADVVPMVQILDTPGLLGGARSGCGECCGCSTCRLSSRSSQCRKISFGPGLPAFCPSSSAEGRTVGGSADGAWIFTGGHCREVPALVTPVPQGRRGGGGGLQGLRAGQDSTAADVEQIFDIPVPQGRRRRNVNVLKVLSQDGVQQRMWSRSLLFLLVEVFQIFSQAKVPHRADFFKMRMQGFEWVFRTFPQPKKCAKVTRQSSPRVPASASSSELSAHQMAPAGESDELADEPGGALDAALADLQRWRRGSEGVTGERGG